MLDHSSFKFGGRVLDLNRPHVMGIVNVTPDSFSDGGTLYEAEQLSIDNAIRRALQMVDDGATFIDVGGESTRPGATPVTLQEEMDRVLPVIERLHAEVDAVISVDTSAPEVMLESARLGAGLINDVRALGREGALQAVAQIGLPVCLMHMKGNPATMQDAPDYDDVLDEVDIFLKQRIDACTDAGIQRQNIILDPGFGFGKALEHNLRLLNNLERFHQLGLPLLLGTSRKSMIDHILDRPVDQRLSGGLATVAIGLMKGAQIFRVHDVKETMDVVRMTDAVLNEGVNRV